jgi:predicted amidohydrolase
MFVRYSGDSSVFSPLGETIWQHSHHPIAHTVTLNKETLLEIRNTLPFLKDADNFIIH